MNFCFYFLGSSTICIGILNKQNGLLQTANLGDSGFVIFRDGKAIVKSEDQYTHPNVPFQIGVKEVKDGKSIPHGNRYIVIVAPFLIHSFLHMPQYQEVMYGIC